MAFFDAHNELSYWFFSFQATLGFLFVAGQDKIDLAVPWNLHTIINPTVNMQSALFSLSSFICTSLNIFHQIILFKEHPDRFGVCKLLLLVFSVLRIQ